MAYDNNQKTNIRTDIVSLWNTSSKQLKIGAISGGLSISIWEPVIGPDGTKKFPNDKRYDVTLSQPQAIKLYNLFGIINEEIASGKERVSYGLICNRAKTTRLSIEYENGVYALSIYRNVDPSTSICNDGSVYLFDNENTTFKDYNPSTGEFTPLALKGDIEVFYIAISAYVNNMGGLFAAHGSKYSDIVNRTAGNFKKPLNTETKYNQNVVNQSPTEVSINDLLS